MIKIFLILLAFSVKGLASPCPDNGRSVELQSRTYSRGSFPAVIHKADFIPQAVQASFFAPRDASVKGPAIVLMLGSQGVSGLGTLKAFISRLNSLGYAVLVPDTNAARGVKSTASNQDSIAYASSYADAYAAMKYLSQLDCVNKNQVALLGYSRGGKIALDLAHEPVAKELGGPNLRFAAHIGVYAWCGVQIDEPKPTGAPLLIQVAGHDDWGTPDQCQILGDKFRKKNTKVKKTVFQEAYHAWNSPGEVRTIPGYEINRCAASMTDDSKMFGLYSHEPMKEIGPDCRGNIVHIGYNAKVTRDSEDEIVRFLNETFSSKDQEGRTEVVR